MDDCDKLRSENIVFAAMLQQVTGGLGGMC